MSTSHALPQTQNHFLGPLHTLYTEPPLPVGNQYISPASNSKRVTDKTPDPTRNKISRRTSASSSSSSSSSTGTTHRISKAKKGKRVHACEYPACTKVFTRAEHRRRHELGHKSKKAHTCSYPGCHKSFHRADYLAQHMARHGGDSNSPKSKQSSLIRIEPVTPYALPSPSITQSSPSSSLASPNIPSIEIVSDDTSQITEQPFLPCLQCFGCRSHQGCEGQGAYFSNISTENYSTGMEYSAVSAVSSASGLLAPHTQLTLAGWDSVIDQYMRTMLRPEAFINPSPSLSPCSQLQEQMNAPFWDINLDLSLSRQNSVDFNTDASNSTWTLNEDEVLNDLQIHQPQSLLFEASKRAF